MNSKKNLYKMLYLHRKEFNGVISECEKTQLYSMQKLNDIDSDQLAIIYELKKTKIKDKVSMIAILFIISIAYVFSKNTTDK